MKKIVLWVFSLFLFYSNFATAVLAEDVEGQSETEPSITEEMIEEVLEERPLLYSSSDPTISAFLTIDGQQTTEEEILLLNQTSINSIVATIAYENLDTSTPYNIWLMTYYENTLFDVNLVFDRTFNNPDGTIRVSAKWNAWQQEWMNMAPGNYYIVIDFQRTDDTSVGYSVPITNLVRFSIPGLSTNIVALEEKLFSGPFALAQADLETVKKGLYVSTQVSYVLDPGQTFDTVMDVYRLDDGGETLIRGDIHSSFTTSEEGSSMIEVGWFDDLEVGIYEVRTRFYRHDTQEEVFLPSTLQDYIRKFEIVDELDEFEDGPSTAKIRIHSYDENTEYLSGSSFQIVDQEGNVVHSWTSGDTYEELELEEGEYFLEELSAPTGYQVNKRQPLTVSKTNAYIRGDLHYGKTNAQNIDTISDSLFHTFDVTPTDASEGPTTGYCFFYGKYDPSSSQQFSTDSLVYKGFLADAEVLKSRYLNNTYDQDTFYQYILKTLYFGYPNDNGGLKAKYNLSDLELQYITQQAVHFFTNDKPYSNVGGTNGDQVNQAYEEMISLVFDESFVVPADLAMYLYIPSNDNYQDILIAQLALPKVMEAEVYHDKEVRTISVQKKWVNDEEENRPESITVYLYQDGKQTEQTLTLSKDNDWTGRFENLLKYDGEKEIQYTIGEVSVDQYDVEISGDMEGFTITNTYQKEEPTPTPTPTIMPTESPTPDVLPTENAQTVVKRTTSSRIEVPYTADTMELYRWYLLGAFSLIVLTILYKFKHSYHS